MAENKNVPNPRRAPEDQLALPNPRQSEEEPVLANPQQLRGLYWQIKDVFENERIRNNVKQTKGVSGEPIYTSPQFEADWFYDHQDRAMRTAVIKLRIRRGQKITVGHSPGSPELGEPPTVFLEATYPDKDSGAIFQIFRDGNGSEEDVSYSSSFSTNDGDYYDEDPSLDPEQALDFGELEGDQEGQRPATAEPALGRVALHGNESNTSMDDSEPVADPMRAQQEADEILKSGKLSDRHVEAIAAIVSTLPEAEPGGGVAVLV